MKQFERAHMYVAQLWLAPYIDEATERGHIHQY